MPDWTDELNLISESIERLTPDDLKRIRAAWHGHGVIRPTKRERITVAPELSRTARAIELVSFCLGVGLPTLGAVAGIWTGEIGLICMGTFAACFGVVITRKSWALVGEDAG